MAEQFANNAFSTLNGGINNAVTSLVVTSAASFPTRGEFRILIDSEILIVTAVSGTTFTVTRGAESTSAASHSNSAVVRHILTSGALKAGRQDYFAHSVLDYGAVGNSNYNVGGGADDTTAFQAALTAAGTAGSGFGAVLIPGGRSYRITSTLNVPIGVKVFSPGNLDTVGFGTPPFLVWDGAASGLMFSVAGSSGYSVGNLFENLNIVSGISITNKLACGVRYGTGARCDSGSGFRNCWFQLINGNAIEVLAGATNFFIHDGRFDSIYGGYGLYVDTTLGSFNGTIDGNVNWVGGGSGQGKGFIFIDGETAGDSNSHLTIVGLHTEVNQSLTQTFASGTNPSDQYGIIRLGVDTGGFGTQHAVSVHGWSNNVGGGLNSFSSFLVTATSGTDTAASNRVKLLAEGGNALHTFASADNAATGEVRFVGGKIPSNLRYTGKSGRQGLIVWGYGADSNGESITGSIEQRHGTFSMHGMFLRPETVSQMGGSFSYNEGSLAYVTDATATTLGTTVAGGGANKVIVCWNGSAWKIIANCN